MTAQLLDLQIDFSLEEKLREEVRDKLNFLRKRANQKLLEVEVVDLGDGLEIAYLSLTSGRRIGTQPIESALYIDL